MNDHLETFGRIVKIHRQALGLTQDELARRVGCATITLRKIEYDDLRPSVQIAERLAVMLNIPLADHAPFVQLARAERGLFTESLTGIPSQFDEIRMHELEGHSIRGYVLGQLIGRGTFGCAYQALQPGMRREVAVKIILSKYANNPEFIRRFDIEAQLVAKLEHPHILPIFDYWREPNAAYFVTRFVREGSLQRLVKNNPPNLEVALHILEQIGSGLNSAHRAGIIHRNLKPSNILLDNDNNVYLTDFGTAASTNTSQLSQSEPINGEGFGFEYKYISPEQIRSESIFPQTDIYSFGIIIYELITGTAPFQGSTPFEIMHHHLNAPIPPLSANRGGLPKMLDTIIARATSKKPSDRYENIESLITDLHKLSNIKTPIKRSLDNLTLINLSLADNPYKGLRAFTELDEGDFFGRESLIQRLLTRLEEHDGLPRFLAVVGPSGSGKSSVVRAGLIPAIRRGALPNSENWFIVDLIPGANPFEELETALLRMAVDPPSNLIDLLKNDKYGLLNSVNQCLPKDSNVQLVLVIDQFEEIFTLLDDEHVRLHLLESLLTAVLADQSRIQVIITLRADFFDRLLNYLDFGEIVSQRSEFVLPLTTDELEQAIVKPAERAGLHIETSVVSTIVHDLADQPGSLPLLQYALSELFNKREGNRVTRGIYNAIGGVRGALGRRAEEVFTGTNPGYQELIRQAFLRLVTLGEGVEDTRRRVIQSELDSIATLRNESRPFNEMKIAEVLANLGKNGLLTFDHDPKTRLPTIEIAHEALIKTWGRLKNWLAESRASLRIQRQLSQAAKEWEIARQEQSYLATGMRLIQFEALSHEASIALNDKESLYLSASISERDRKEYEKKYQQRRFTSVLFISLMVAIALTLFALVQRKNALIAVQTAFSRQVAAQALAEVQFPLGNDEYAALLAIRSLKIEYNPVADAALVKAYSSLPLIALEGHFDKVSAVKFSPDGKYTLTGSDDAVIRLWDTKTGVLVRIFSGHTDEITYLSFSPDGKSIASASVDGTARVWDIATARTVYVVEGYDAEVQNVAFSPNGQFILTTTDKGGAKIWDADTGKFVMEIGRGRIGLGAVFSPDGKYILSGDSGDSYAARLWDVSTGQDVQTFMGHSSWVYSAAFSSDGKFAVTGSLDNTAILWNINTGEEILTFRGHSNSVRVVAFSPDNKYILTGSGDRTIRLWNAETGQEIHSWRAHLQRVLSADFSPDGRYFITGSSDGTTKIWDVKIGNGRILSGHSAEVYGVAFSPDGNYALTTSLDQTMKLWNINTGEEVRTISTQIGVVYSVSYSPDSYYALTSNDEGEAKLWDINTGKELLEYVGHESTVYNAIFSPNGKYVLTASKDTTAKLWETSTGKEVRTFHGHTDDILAVSFSFDGKYIATGGDDSTAKIWNVESGNVIHNFQGSDIVTSVAISPDSNYLMVGTADGTAQMWDIVTGKEIFTLKGHSNTIYDVAFSPDGKSAVTASADRTAKIWNVITGEEIRTLSGHESAIWGVSFSPNGKYILTGSFDGTARLWEVDYKDFIANVCAFLLRDFTEDERIRANIVDFDPTCP